jgi:hypothetical protein
MVCMMPPEMKEANEKKNDGTLKPQTTGGIEGLFRKIFGKQHRGPQGGADPSALCGSQIDEEEDILHIKNLPTFGGRMSQRDTELIASYLTAPYIRIPLCLAYFSSQEHINLLGVKQLRSILDGVLFEPSLWQPNEPKIAPLTIPAPDRKHLATPWYTLCHFLSFLVPLVHSLVWSFVAVCYSMNYNVPHKVS